MPQKFSEHASYQSHAQNWRAGMAFFARLGKTSLRWAASRLGAVPRLTRNLASQRRSTRFGATLIVSCGAFFHLPALCDSSADARTSSTTKASTRAPAWRTLDPMTCQVLTAEQLARLPAVWHRYATVAKGCKLPAPGRPTRLTLVSIFTEDYYRDRPVDAPWEEFPKPLLLDQDFRCVGVLPEIYPIEQPRELTLRHGQWRDGLPQEIRIHVSNPAIGGDYKLPVLRWDPTLKLYQSKGSTTIKDIPCPTF